jgi:ABC-type glycerol-3-phosphate transport system substrate-binding protein
MWQTSTHKAAAAKWIEYATSPKGAMNAIDSVSGFLPGRVSLMTQAPWTSTPWTQFARQMKTAYPYQYPAPEIPQMGKIEVETVQDAVQRVASGAQNVDQSTAQLCQTMNAELAK